MARLNFQETMDRLLLLIRAGYPVIYIISHEETRVLDCLGRVVHKIRQQSSDDPSKRSNKQLWRWYEGVGLERAKNLDRIELAANATWLETPGLPPLPDWDLHRRDQQAGDALKLVGDKAKLEDMPQLADSLTVFFDLHQYLRVDGGGGAGPMVRPLRNTAANLRKYYDANRRNTPHRYNTIVIVAPTGEMLSPELDRDLIRLDFPLPETDELLDTLRGLVEQRVLKFPNPVPDDEFQAVCGGRAGIGDVERQQDYESLLSNMIANAGCGLTLEDYKLGLNMFAVTGRTLSSSHIEDMLNLKAKAISNQALQYTPHVEVELGGLDEVKAWVGLRKEPIISPQARDKYRLPSPKGVMLCGVSGGGKSQLAKLIAKEFNLALLRLDIGALFGSYIGESEMRTREALRLAETLAPVVLWIDELDKCFTGVGAGGDNGVSARVFGHFLTWLAEKQDNVFVVTTANDFLSLLGQFPEFGRKGRFDEIFWVDLPKNQARHEIFRIYLERHLEDGFLIVSQNDVNDLKNAIALEYQPVGDTPVEQFLSLLSDKEVSGNMTGAEIEYAVAESLYEAYKLDQRNALRQANNFTPALIVEVVRKAKERSLHRPGGTADKTRDILKKEAEANHWISV